MKKFSDGIISIRPNFAEAILSGSKTVELRRRIPPIEVGTRLWIYATRPISAVVGSAVVDRIIRGTPDGVWAACAGEAAIERADFDAYFDGAAAAIGLELCDIRRGKPVAIEELRQMRSGFHPPQVITRLTQNEVVALKLLAGGHSGCAAPAQRARARR